jgi:hypothetical protein
VYLDKKECDKAVRHLPDSISQKYLISSYLGQGGFGTVSLIFEKVKHEAEMQNSVTLTSRNFKLSF